MHPHLEQITRSRNYGDLPETWRVPDIERFSAGKTLYDYQTDALENAARGLFVYYGDAHDWSAAEAPAVDDARKEMFAGLYGRDIDNLDVKRYETRSAEQNQIENPVFRILSRFIAPQGDAIAYRRLINRMCFWMATGSGKTLVMVKLLEYLHALQKHREIPPHNILILAPSEHLLGQIRRTVEEFNQTGLRIELVPLRDLHRGRQAQLGDAVTVYYHRSDNLSDVQKDALTDYRVYENDGQWFILLDEAHKGGKEDSKRQAYYAVLARRGFLFNFSATFTDAEDIVTTVKKYNLEEFIKHGHGKNIYLNEKEYGAFAAREIDHGDRRRIVLKSLLTLGFAGMRVRELRAESKQAQLYHLPLMLTLVNSVNTDIENERNDLWAFFQTLREIAAGEIDDASFRAARDELIDEWRDAQLLFGGDGGGIVGAGEEAMKKMKITDLREAVFLSRRKGALQVIRSGDNKELAFQLKNADAPFALIRIGDTSKWRNKLLAGYEETAALQERSFFAELEHSSITILLGSRAFFESWDSNRPNVINFINIGGREAKKFVVQSVGRGVRIETLPGKRRRFSFLAPEIAGQRALQTVRDRVQLPETLFLFATNRAAIKAVLAGLESEKRAAFEALDVFSEAPRKQIHGADMPLLAPAYRETADDSARAAFSMNAETLARFQVYLAQTSDALLAVRDGLDSAQIARLRAAVAGDGGITIDAKNYAMLAFLQSRLLAHLAKTATVSDGVRAIDDEDIVHFRHIRAHPERARELRKEIEQVKTGGLSVKEKRALAGRYAQGEIDEKTFQKQIAGKDESKLDDLTIKNLAGHYYLPVVWGNERADYMQHIIKFQSEVDFLNDLETWLGKNMPAWDAWMFSKIDESLDRIHIPYFDGKRNEYRNFCPDFVFWMCKGDAYRIVFVDPKGTEHAQAMRKIDGYKTLFEAAPGSPREFSHGKNWQVSVRLIYFHRRGRAAVPKSYRCYWSADPGTIFA